MTPSRRLAARAVGGVVAAVTAGGVGKSALEEDVRKACPAAIAQRVLDLGLDDANIADGIKRLQEDYGVDDEDFATMCTNVYSVYLVGMAKNPLTKTAELKELSSLRNALDLDNQQTGQGHADAAVQFYRDILRYTTEDELDDEDHPDRISLDKLLFLSERAFRQGGETDEAFTFEFSRVAKNLGGIEMEEALDRVRDVALPFYERALSSTRSKLESGAVSSDMLTRARATLGIDEADAKDMHIEAFGKEVRVQLGLSEEDDEGDEELDYDEGNRLGTEADALKKLEEMTKAEEKKSKVIKDTSGIKFKDGAYGHVSILLLFVLELFFASLCRMHRYSSLSYPLLATFTIQITHSYPNSKRFFPSPTKMRTMKSPQPPPNTGATPHSWHSKTPLTKPKRPRRRGRSSLLVRRNCSSRIPI